MPRPRLYTDEELQERIKVSRKRYEERYPERIKTSRKMYHAKTYAKHYAKRRLRLESIAGRPRPLICELCGAGDRMIHFDHDHATGKFRGWICQICNQAFGMVRDNVDLLEKMKQYLIRGGIDPAPNPSKEDVDFVLKYFNKQEMPKEKV